MKSQKKQENVAFRTLHYYLKALSKYKLLSALALILNPAATVLRNVLVPLTFAKIVDSVSSGGLTEAVIFNELVPLGVMCVIAQAVAAAFSNIVLYSTWRMELNAMYDLNSHCFNTISEQSMQFHNDRFSGSLVSMVGKFTSGFERLFDLIIWTILPFLTSVIGVIAALFFKAPVVAVVMIFIIVTFMTIAYFAFKKTAEIAKREATTHNKTIGQLSDSISNIMSVKSYAKEKYELSRYQKFQKKYMDVSFEHMRVTISRDILFDMINVFNIGFMVFFLLTGTTWFGLSVGTLILIVTYLNEIMGQLWRSHSIFKEINRIFGDANDMTMALDEPDDVVDEPGAKQLVINKPDVVFNNISFKHKDAKSEIFSDFNLKIKPGERIGLVGISGSGKTTITKLLLRFADVDDGEILISDTNIKHVTQNSLRENVAYVPQETALFHRSIAENISYGKPGASIEEIKRAAKLANADVFIEDLPNGYDTLVGERGVKLSGGQRQRIAIARAILKDAPILVLDEATSALDSESEALIQDALSRLMKGRTSIVVAHRLSTVAGLDRIIVLSDGKIVEEGTHDELLKKDGAYKKLWSRQSGAFRKGEK
ncbi:ABC transporter ATP-binding protein [Candidatus Saccharibacteria bacterium]|nr:ABC transporter ATP-binding protein [Candidatus Saccharibacteria bacterium]